MQPSASLPLKAPPSEPPQLQRPAPGIPAQQSTEPPAKLVHPTHQVCVACNTFAGGVHSSPWFASAASLKKDAWGRLLESPARTGALRRGCCGCLRPLLLLVRLLGCLGHDQRPARQHTVREACAPSSVRLLPPSRRLQPKHVGNIVNRRQRHRSLCANNVRRGRATCAMGESSPPNRDGQFRRGTLAAWRVHPWWRRGASHGNTALLRRPVATAAPPQKHAHSRYAHPLGSAYEPAVASNANDAARHDAAPTESGRGVAR